MKRTIIIASLTAAVATGSLYGGAGHGVGRAIAGKMDGDKEARAAAKLAGKADRALRKERLDDAIRYGEAAVALSPGDAGYRALLGRAYLAAGRFASARTALTDAVSLDETNGPAALNLALAEIATGSWDEARATLDAHVAHIAPRDRGLALALAGDPAAAVEVLEAAARAPDADGTTRQNYALALALAGRWQDAKVVAAMDVAPAEVDQRIMQWAAFSKPTSAADQVAAILGVTPVLDGGQPVGLALARSPAPALASADPVDAYMPGTPDPDGSAPVAEPVVAVAEPSAVPEPAVIAAATDAVPAALVARVVFAPRREVVQAIPMERARRDTRVAGVPSMLARAGATEHRAVGRGRRDAAVLASLATDTPAATGGEGGGSYVVQLGAYDNAGVAEDGWRRLSRAVPMLRGYTPSGAQAVVNGTSLYRLSLTGFSRADAAGMCTRLRAQGGRCFVRAAAGDAMAAWLKQPALASRS